MKGWWVFPVTFIIVTILYVRINQRLGRRMGHLVDGAFNPNNWGEMFLIGLLGLGATFVVLHL
ncbi:MAG: hypothetical protein GC190_07415 [Alphaproteobacteria bacterium]|nr:hypothetical protein [Alphaproteobacteria bacterium]